MTEQKVKIKICGLRREEDISIVNEVMPDYIGFVFANRKREISQEAAAYLATLLKPQIRKVGVFVDAPKERVIGMLQKGIIDIAQLHGNESEEYVERIRQESGKTVIKAVILQPEQIGNTITTGADYLLLDSGKGSGRCLDWNHFPQKSEIGKPFFLAGGLTPENVAGALDRLRDTLPYAVDVSSGVESDGYKDSEKIKAFVRAVRSFH